MKKLAIGIFVLGIFVLYSLGVRAQNPVLAITSSHASGGSTPSSKSSTTGAGSPPPSGSSKTRLTPGGSSKGGLKDGAYSGSVADAYYGSVQVRATISGGKITDVKFLQYPNTHQTSVAINQQAMPYLKQEALQAQSGNVQIISGATYTSQAFRQSLQAALSKA